MNRYFNCSVSGHYDIFDLETTEPLTTVKNHLIPNVFIALFENNIQNKVKFNKDYTDARLSQVVYTEYNKPTYDLSVRFDDRVQLQLELSNQINLRITKTSHNFAPVKKVLFDEEKNKAVLKSLGIKPAEIIDNKEYLTLMCRVAFLLPADNVGNITGIGISVTDVQTYTTDKLRLMSVAHVRDESGKKGTIPYSYNKKIGVVYNVTYKFKKPLTGITYLPEPKQYYNALSFIRNVYSPNLMFNDGDKINYTQFAKTGDEIEVLTEFGDNVKLRHIVHGEHFYYAIIEAVSGANIHSRFIQRVYDYSTSSWNEQVLDFPSIKATYANVNTGLIETTILHNDISYDSFYKIEDIINEPEKFQKIFNNEPFKFRFKYNDFFYSDEFIITPDKNYTKFALKFTMKFKLNEGVIYDK